MRGGYDETVIYRGEDDGDDEEEEREQIELSLSEWLLFGMPDVGDRFLADWRAQWHIVNAVGRIEDFAGIYGFTGEYVETLERYDIPVWRRFLCDVIDPRFDRSAIGELPSRGRQSGRGPR